MPLPTHLFIFHMNFHSNQSLNKPTRSWKCLPRLKLLLTLSMHSPFFWAYDPQSIKMMPRLFAFNHWMTASVNFSQPLPAWLLAWLARTVKQALRSKTPDNDIIHWVPCITARVITGHCHPPFFPTFLLLLKNNCYNSVLKKGRNHF